MRFFYNFLSYLFIFCSIENVSAQNVRYSALDSVSKLQLIDLRIVLNINHIQDSVGVIIGNTLMKMETIDKDQDYDKYEKLKTQISEQMKVVTIIGFIRRYKNQDSLFGISISEKCFDSLIIAYNALMSEKEYHFSNEMLLDMVCIYNTFQCSYYLQPKAIYIRFQENIKQKRPEIINKLGFIKSEWGSCFFSERYNLILLYGKGETHPQMKKYLRNSKYALRYGEA